MIINKNKENTKFTLALEGRLDTATSPELDAIIDTELTGISELVFDLAALDYISSAGLRVILKAQKIMTKQGSMKLIHVNEAIMEIFDITGFMDILTIE